MTDDQTPALSSHQIDNSTADQELVPILNTDNVTAGKGRPAGEKEINSDQWGERRRALVVGLLVSVQVMTTTSFSIIAAFFPLEAKNKGSTSFTTGIIISASSFSLVIFTPICGLYLLPMAGVRTTFLSGLILLGGSFFLLGFLVDVPAGTAFVVCGVVLRFTEGVGWAMVGVTIVGVVPILYPSNIGTVNGLLLGGQGLGFTAGPPVGSILATVGGYRLPFLFGGGIALCFILPTLLIVKPIEYKSDTLPLPTLFSLFISVRFILLLLAVWAVHISLSFLYVTLSIFLSKQYGMSEIEMGLLFGAMAVSYVVTSVPTGQLIDKFGATNFVVSGLILGGVALIIIGSIPFIPALYKWVIFPGLILLTSSMAQTSTGSFAGIFIQAQRQSAEENGKNKLYSAVSGISIFFRSSGVFLGGILGGLLTTLTDFPTVATMFGEAKVALGLIVLGVALIDIVPQWYHRKRFSSSPQL